MKYPQTVVSALLALVLCAGLLPANAETLYVGTDTAFVPFEYKGADGRYTGFDIELWDAVAKKIGVEYELRPMDFNGLLPGIATGVLDVALAAIFITPEREKMIDFSIPYFKAGLKVMVLSENTDIHEPEDLKGRVVAVKTGTATVKYVTSLKPARIKKFPNIDQAYLEVLTGGADAAMHDTPNVLYFIKIAGKGRVKAVGSEVEAAEYGIAFPKGSALRGKVSAALREMMKNGEYNLLYRKWFGANPE